MIKRTAALLLILLYSITVTGVAFNLHYCCNRLVAVQINTPVKSCGMAALKSKCCKNTHLEIKVKDMHQGASGQTVASSAGFTLSRLYSTDYIVSATYITNVVLNSSHPPGNSRPVFLKNCVFRV
jgi:hypothetical protein